MRTTKYKEGDLVGGCLYLKDVECPSHLKEKRRFAKFVCTCGRLFERSIISQNRTKGRCLECLKETVGKWNKTHGEPHRSKEYKLWCAIKDRCYNVNCKEYSYYGGRGIKMHEAWLNDFPSFLEYIGRAPSVQHSLEREDNNKGYEPGNIKWATKREQARNRKTTVFVEYKGQQRKLIELSEEFGVEYRCLHARIFKLKWSAEKAVSEPVR